MAKPITHTVTHTPTESRQPIAKQLLMNSLLRGEWTLGIHRDLHRMSLERLLDQYIESYRDQA